MSRFVFFSSRRRHTRSDRDWSSDVCSSDLHRGALPEIITPEVGALRDTLDDLVEASRTIATRSSEACRAHATRYFTHITMAEEYVRVYHHLIANGALPPGRPTS